MIATGKKTGSIMNIPVVVFLSIFKKSQDLAFLWVANSTLKFPNISVGQRAKKQAVASFRRYLKGSKWFQQGIWDLCSFLSLNLFYIKAASWNKVVVKREGSNKNNF